MRDNEIIDYAVELGSKCEVSSWLDLKKILLISLPSEQRTKFSTRDPFTKQQGLNKFERQIIDSYNKTTGVNLELPGE